MDGRGSCFRARASSAKWGNDDSAARPADPGLVTQEAAPYPVADPFHPDGAGYFFQGPQDEKIPNWLAQVWAVMLLVTGAMALIAHLTRWDRERGMYVERGALTLQAAAVSGYALALPGILGWQADTALALIAGAAWVGTNLWEVQEISKDLKLISAVQRLNSGSDNASN